MNVAQLSMSSKTRRNEWQEAKLCQVYKPGSIDKRHQANRVFGEQGSFLVDYYHLSEYFADAAEECAGPKKEARVEWRHTRQDRMKSGDIDAVLTELDQHRNGKKGKAANKSEACHRYIRNRPGQFDYAAAKAARLPDKTGQPSLIPVTWNFTGLIRSIVILLSSPDDSPTGNREAPKPCSPLPPH